MAVMLLMDMMMMVMVLMNMMVVMACLYISTMTILLLETPCPSVRWFVRHVFYPHLTRTHTNLICERAR